MNYTETAVADKLSDENYLIDEFNKHKGQFVITPDFTVERLLAMLRSAQGQDKEYYFLTFNGKKPSVHRVQPGKFFIALEKIDRHKYKKLVSIAKLTHHDQPSIFGTSKKNNQARSAMEQYNQKVRADVVRSCEGMELMTKICWQIG